MSLTGFTISSVGAETYDFVEPASSSELFAIVDEVRLHVSPLHPQFSLSYIAQMHCAHHLLAHADMYPRAAQTSVLEHLLPTLIWSLVPGKFNIGVAIWPSLEYASSQTWYGCVPEERPGRGQ